jgi:hypothetical protein
VLTNGPIRVMFELVYEPFEVNGAQVAQVLRVSLDGGSQLNHFQTFYRRQSGSEPLAVAVGLKAWSKYVDEFAEARRSPIAILVK